MGRQELLNADRFKDLFTGTLNDGRSSDIDKSSSNTASGDVYQVSSSEDKIEVEGSHAGAQPSKTSPKKARRRRTRGKEFHTPHQEKQTAASPMAGPSYSRPPTRIRPSDPDPTTVSTNVKPTISSSSTRASTNHGKPTGPYNKNGLRSHSAHGGWNNNFEADKPGQYTPATSATGSLGYAAPLPAFKKHGAAGKDARSAIPSFMKGTQSDLPEKENRSSRPPAGSHEASRSHASANPGIARSDKGHMAIAGRAMGGKRMTIQGRAASERDEQYKHMIDASSHAASVTSNPPETNEDPEFLRLVLDKSNATEVPGTSNKSKGKGKAKGNTVIELDDDSDDHDSIVEDSDASGPQVTSSRSSIRARMGSGPSTSASKTIPVGNTQARKQIYETKPGNTIHRKPPGHDVNASPDSFTLDNSKGKKGGVTMVGSMKSKSNSGAQASSALSRIKSKKDTYVLPLSMIITIDGQYGPSENNLALCVGIEEGVVRYFVLTGGCTPKRVDSLNKPHLKDLVVNADHIERLTVTKDLGESLTFLQITIEQSADLHEPSAPRSSFYLFLIKATSATMDAQFGPVKEILRAMGQQHFPIEWVSKSELEKFRQAANDRARIYARESKEAQSSIEKNRRSDSSKGDQRTSRQTKIQDLMQPKHNHQIEDVKGEEAPVVIGAKKPRPKGRPSAGSNPAARAAADPGNIFQTTGSSSTTLSTSDDGTTDTDIDLSRRAKSNDKRYRSAAANDFAAADDRRTETRSQDRNQSTSRNSQNRTSTSPELTSSKAMHSRARHTRSSKDKADARMKTCLGDSDDEDPLNPLLWTGRLTPEEETALVFPREGTGAVTVINSDINRLAPGEFLNDTLIEYGMKRIWSRIRDRDPMLADQVHMFSSFFYKKLSTRDRKTKIDPYDTVRKWTSKIDIFDKKYIFVPINEYFHWYLAIIVNPARVLKPPHPHREKSAGIKRTTRSSQENTPQSAKRKQDSTAITTSRFFLSEDDANEAGTASDAPGKRVDHDTTLGQYPEELPEPELPESDLSRSTSPVRIMQTDEDATATPKQAIRTTNDVISLEQRSVVTEIAGHPTLDDRVRELTLDSSTPAALSDLDDESKHPGVIHNLKNYLIREAKDKGKLSVDAEVPLAEADGIFKGLAAAVPQQPNMSDCGLYVLHFTEVFLQNDKELMPILMKRVKIAPADTDKRWHHERAEKKRSVFYDELLEESKEWKAWRAQKDAEKASETPAEDNDIDEEDEGEDIELVSQVQDVSPARPSRKGKLRRHSDMDSVDSDPQSPDVKPVKPSSTSTGSRQRSSARNDGIVVEVQSPPRPRATRKAHPLPTAEAQLGEMNVDVLPFKERSASPAKVFTSTPKRPSSHDSSVNNLNAEILNEIAHKINNAPHARVLPKSADGLAHGMSHASSSQVLAQGHSGVQSELAGAATVFEDDSGSEDSKAEVTDDETSKAPGSSPHLSKSGFRNPRQDVQDDSFRAEMISPVPRLGQAAPNPNRMSLDSESSLENVIRADTSLYKRRDRTPISPDTSTINHDTVLATLGQKPQQHKRQRSRDSDMPGLSATEEDPHLDKRARSAGEAPHDRRSQNKRRTIPQSPTPEKDGHRGTFGLDHQSSPSQSKNHSLPRFPPPSSASTRRGPPSSQSRADVIDISDEEDEDCIPESQTHTSARKTPRDLDSQKMRSPATIPTSSSVREPLGRPVPR